MFPYYSYIFHTHLPPNPFWNPQLMMHPYYTNHFSYQPITEINKIQNQQLPNTRINTQIPKQEHLQDNPSKTQRQVQKQKQEKCQENQNDKAVEQELKALKKKSKQKKQNSKDQNWYCSNIISEGNCNNNSRYTNKNIESNITNQVFSFIWSDYKSKSYLLTFYANSKEKVTIYYEYFKILKRNVKRYMNRNYLADLCQFSEGHIGFKTVTKNTQWMEYLSMEEFSKGIRYLINLYLTQICPISILTSKKMRKFIWLRHLQKCRALKSFLFSNQLQQNQQEQEGEIQIQIQKQEKQQKEEEQM